MSLIASIPASGSANIPIQNVYEFLQFANDGNPFDGTNFTVQLSYKGRQRITITSNNLLKQINAVTSNYVEKAGGVVSIYEQLLQTAIGGVGNEQGEIRVTNNDAVQGLDIYGYSTAMNEGLVCRYDESTIIANSNELYTNFEVLAFDATFDSAQVRFADGWEDRFSPTELRGLMSQLSQSQKVDRPNALDNRTGIIESVRIYSLATPVQVLSKSYEEL